MFKQLKLAVGAAVTATLVACGGGGDSGTTATPTEKTFPLQQIYLSYLNTSHSYTISSSGLISGAPAVSTGTRTYAAAKPATFENSASFLVVENRFTSFTQPFNQSSSSILESHFDSLGQLIGFTQRDSVTAAVNSYTVKQGAAAGFPVSAKINDVGNLTSLNYYTDASKKTLGATSVATWSLKAGFAGSAALLEVKTIGTGVGADSSSTIISTDQYSIDNNNVMTLVKAQGEARNGLVVVLNSTDTFTGK